MIACICPSRGRPGNVERLVQAWADTLHGEFMTMAVVVDPDDPELTAYEANAERWPSFASLWHAPREGMRLGGILNWLGRLLADTNGSIGFMGDDHVPRTPGWDELICAGLDRHPGTGVVYGNDLVMGANLPTAVFLGHRILQGLGGMVLPGQTHLFMDNLWKRIGEELGTLTYLPDVVIEHVHPIAGGAEWDDTYRAANADAVWAADQALFEAWVAGPMAIDVECIRAAAR